MQSCQLVRFCRILYFFKGKYGSTFFPAKIRVFFKFFFYTGSEIYTHYLCYENMVRVFE